MMWSKKWAQKSLTVNADKCTGCGLCQKYCPVDNISIQNKNFSFGDKCISCQRCIHGCPANAFLYKGKPIDQYKLMV